MALTNQNLIKALEDSFKIVLSKEDLENIYTPEDIEDLVLFRVDTKNESQYNKERSFYMLRNFISTEFGINKEMIKAGCNLCKLIPKERHVEFWNKLQDISQSKKFPSLSHPLWLTRSIAIITPIMIFFSIISILFFKIWYGVIIALLIILTLLLLLLKFDDCIPSYYCNASEIIKFLTYSNSDNFINEKKWDKENILERIELIVLKELNLAKYDPHLIL